MTNQDKTIVALAEALELLARLGAVSGGYGNSHGNLLAQQALQTQAKAIQEAKERLQQ